MVLTALFMGINHDWGCGMLTITEVDSERHETLETFSRKADPSPDPGTSDEELIKAIARGQRPAMAVLYARHSARVYRFALRMIGDAGVAEDIVSEVFLDVWRQAGRFEVRSQVSTWLLAITRNKSLSAIRSRSDEQLDDERRAEVEDPAADPEMLVHNKDRSAVIRSCLSRLSVAHREVIDLVYYHENSVDEAARIIGVPASTVKTRMFYARQRLGGLLEAAGYDHA